MFQILSLITAENPAKQCSQQSSVQNSDTLLDN